MKDLTGIRFNGIRLHSNVFYTEEYKFVLLVTNLFKSIAEAFSLFYPVIYVIL